MSFFNPQITRNQLSLLYIVLGSSISGQQNCTDVSTLVQYVLPLHIDAESLPFFSAYYTLHSWRVLYASDPVHSFGPFSDRNFGFCQLSRQHAKGVDRRKCRLKGPFQVRGIKMHLKCKVFTSYYQRYPSAPLLHPHYGVPFFLKDHSYFFTFALLRLKTYFVKRHMKENKKTLIKNVITPLL